MRRWPCAQGIKCFPLYLSRIILGVLIAIVYGATYSNLGTTFRAGQARTGMFTIVVAFMPLLALTSLPVYHNSILVRRPRPPHMHANIEGG